MPDEGPRLPGHTFPSFFLDLGRSVVGDLDASARVGQTIIGGAIEAGKGLVSAVDYARTHLVDPFLFGAEQSPLGLGPQGGALAPMKAWEGITRVSFPELVGAAIGGPVPLANLMTDYIERQLTENEPHVVAAQEFLRKLPPVSDQKRRWDYIQEHMPLETAMLELSGDPTNLVGIGAYPRMLRAAASSLDFLPIASQVLRFTARTATVFEDAVNWTVGAPFKAIGTAGGALSDTLKATPVVGKWLHSFHAQTEAYQQMHQAVRQSLGSKNVAGTAEDSKAFLENLRSGDVPEGPELKVKSMLEQVMDSYAHAKYPAEAPTEVTPGRFSLLPKSSAEAYLSMTRSSAARLGRFYERMSNVPANKLAEEMSREYADIFKDATKAQAVLDRASQKRAVLESLGGMTQWPVLNKVPGGFITVPVEAAINSVDFLARRAYDVGSVAYHLNRGWTHAQLLMLQLAGGNLVEETVRAANGGAVGLLSAKQYNAMVPLEADPTKTYLRMVDEAVGPASGASLKGLDMVGNPLREKWSKASDFLNNAFINWSGPIATGVRRNFKVEKLSQMALEEAHNARGFSPEVSNGLNRILAWSEEEPKKMAFLSNFFESQDGVAQYMGEPFRKAFDQELSQALPDVPAVIREELQNWMTEGLKTGRLPNFEPVMGRVQKHLVDWQAHVPETVQQWLGEIETNAANTPIEQFGQFITFYHSLADQLDEIPKLIRRNTAQEVVANVRLGTRLTPEAIDNLWRAADDRLDAVIQASSDSMRELHRILRDRAPEIGAASGRGDIAVREAILASDERLRVLRLTWEKDQAVRRELISMRGSDQWHEARDVVWREYDQQIAGLRSRAESEWENAAGGLDRSGLSDNIINRAFPHRNWQAYSADEMVARETDTLEYIRRRGEQTLADWQGGGKARMLEMQSDLRGLKKSIDADPVAKQWFREKGAAINKRADELLDETFTSYDHANLVDDTMRAFMPFFIYETRSWRWLLEQSAKKPLLENMFSPWGNILGNPHGAYWRATDEKGYTDGTPASWAMAKVLGGKAEDYQVRPVAGTIFGRIKRDGPFNHRMYPAGSDNESVKAYSQMQQSLAAFGLYPGSLIDFIGTSEDLAKSSDGMAMWNAAQKLPPPAKAAIDVISAAGGFDQMLGRYGEEAITNILLNQGYDPKVVREGAERGEEYYKTLMRDANTKAATIQIMADQLAVTRFRPQLIEKMKVAQEDWVKRNISGWQEEDLEKMRKGEASISVLYGPQLTPELRRSLGEIYKEVPGWFERGRYLKAPSVQKQLDSTNDYFDTMATVKATMLEQQRIDDREFLMGKLSPREWLDSRNERAGKMPETRAAALDAVKRATGFEPLITRTQRNAFNLATGFGVPMPSRASEALETYWSIRPEPLDPRNPNGPKDFDTFWAQREQAIAGQPKAVQDVMRAELLRLAKSPVDALYMQDAPKLRELAQARARIREQAGITEDVLDAQQSGAPMTGDERRAVSRYNILWEREHLLMLRDDPDLLAAAVRWQPLQVPQVLRHRFGSVVGSEAVRQSLVEYELNQTLGFKGTTER